MKNLAILILIFGFFCKGEGFQYNTSILGGFTKLYGINSKDIDLGLHLEGQFFGNINSNTQIGGGVSFSRFQDSDFLPGLLSDADNASGKLSLGQFMAYSRHTYEILPYLKVFLQPGLGVSTIHSAMQVEDIYDSDSDIGFGISIGGGVQITKILLYPSYKISYIEDEVYEWLALSVGINI